MRKKGNDDMKQDKQAGGLAGIYQATSRGFGFLVPEDGGGREDDWFIPPRAEGGAWHGDRVLARPEDEGGEEGRRRTARITAVVERANKTVTGVLVRHNRGLWLRPDSDRLPGPIQVLTKRKGVRAGDRAAVAMTSFGSAKHPPMGTMREVFGPAGDRESAVAALLYQYEIDREFPDAVMLEAKATPQSVEESAVAGRLDLRDKVVITIDGASSKDLDDAVSLERDGLGRWVLGVHIADVSHYVRPGSALDLEAWERGTSVYFADQVVPMLPRELSNGICSLNPRVDRLALSCVMTLTPEGEVVDHTIAKSVIRTTERMTYEDCNALLAHSDPALAERYARILPMLEDMAALSRVLEGRRRRRGALELDTRESYVVCDESGTPVDVVLRTPGISEGLIESFMLAANECVAEHLNRLESPGQALRLPGSREALHGQGGDAAGHAGPPGLRFEGGRRPLPPEAAGHGEGEARGGGGVHDGAPLPDEGPVRRGKPGALRPGGQILLPLHLPHSPLPRSDGPPHPHRPAGREAVRRDGAAAGRRGPEGGGAVLPAGAGRPERRAGN